MSGRTVIVTGASSGIGYEVARYLCEGGNDVILACRNKDKTERAIEKIKRANPNALATFMELDLASKESIQKFVDDFHASDRKLHVLVNNAGVAMAPKDTKIQVTKDNFELTMGTNHLGPFMLTNLLLEDLKKAAGEENGDARIIMVTAAAHSSDSKRKQTVQALDLDDMFCYKDGAFSGVQAYKNSKVANVMFAGELARKLDGSNVTVNCIYPGLVPSTELMRSSPMAQKAWNRYVLHGVLRFAKLTRTAAQAATAVCNLVTEDKYKGVSGKYFVNGEETQSHEDSRDEEKQGRLWQLSGGYLHMEGFEELEVPAPPPPKEEPKKEKKKAGAAAAAAEAEGEAAAAEGGEAEAKDEAKEEVKDEAAAEQKEGEETTTENKTDEEKKPTEETTDEKKDDEKEKAEEKPAAEEQIEVDDVKLEKEKINEAEKPAAPEVTA